MKGKGYFIPFDGKSEIESWIDHNEILESICHSNAHHVFLLVDACFGGSSLFRDFYDEEKRDEIRYAQRVDCFSSRFALAAGRIEMVLDGRPGANSPFMQSVLYFLKTNRENIFAVSLLIQHITRAVATKTSQTPIGGYLNSEKNEGGEFVFFRATYLKSHSPIDRPTKVFALHKKINRDQQLQALKKLGRLSKEEVRIAFIPAHLVDQPENLIENFVDEQYKGNVHWILDHNADPPQLIPLKITDSLTTPEDILFEMSDYWEIKEKAIKTGEGILKKFPDDKKPIIFPLRLEKWGPHTVELLRKVLSDFWGLPTTNGREVYIFISVILPDENVSPKKFWKKVHRNQPSKRALKKFNSFCAELKKHFGDRAIKVKNLNPIPAEEIILFLKKEIKRKDSLHKDRLIDFIRYLEGHKEEKETLTMFEIENWVIKYVS